MSVLVVAEHLRGQVRGVTRELITAAQELSGPVVVAVIGRDPAALVGQVNLAGVDEVIRVSVDAAEFENDVYQQAVEALVTERQPSVTMLGFTVNSMGFAPAVAINLGIAYASDVFAVREEAGALIATRAFYGGRAHGEIEFSGRGRVLLLLRPTVWKPANRPGEATESDFVVATSSSRARHREFVDQPPADVDITTADFLLSIGRGVGEKENVPMFQQLAERMGATLSSSRPIVDAGWMSRARQVGQSGKTVQAKVYLALGVSGAVQHLAGIKACGTIIAVNTDPEAPIFSVAHYGAVTDLFLVAEELKRLYSNAAG